MIVLDTNVVSELMRRSPDPAVETWRGSRDNQDFEDMGITLIDLWVSW